MEIRERVFTMELENDSLSHRYNDSITSRLKPSNEIM